MDTTPTPTLHSRPRTAVARACGALIVALLATPAFAAEDVSTAGTVSEAPLAPGAFEWAPERASSGPVTVVVSLPEQMAHVYRGDVRIGRSTVSSGREGHDTPPGVYEILEKQKMHHSNKYNNAPMPFMQRLTWDGIALHAGQIPGYPASHGCVRLPKAFAEQLFEVTERGGRVVIADATQYSEAVLRPGDRVPVDPWTGLEPGSPADAVAIATDGPGASGAPALAGK